MKNIHITEKQLKFIKEALDELDVAVSMENGNFRDGFQKAYDDAQKAGVDPSAKDVNFVTTGDNLHANGLSENVICQTSKRKIKEARLKKLSSESKKYTKKTFKNYK